MHIPNPLRPREIALLCLLGLWIAAVLRVEHAPPLRPPAVPYARAVR